MSQERLFNLLKNGKDNRTVQIRSGYDGSDEGTPLICPEPTLARQSEAESCDLNIILKRYAKTGQLPVFDNIREGFYGDVTEIPDYQEAMNRIATTEQYFEQLPPDLRNRFDNNPAAFLDWMADDANIPEAIKLGLITDTQPSAPPTAATPAAPPVPPTGAGGPPPA